MKESLNRTNVSRIYGPATEDCKLAKIRRSNDLFTAHHGDSLNERRRNGLAEREDREGETGRGVKRGGWEGEVSRACGNII